MPNLPTSLILVLLAIAWLWVLVPMFARSREAVPETDDGIAGFRVLRRAGVRLRRPAFHRRRDADEEDFVADDDLRSDVHGDFRDDVDEDSDDDRDGEDLVESLVDQDDDFDDFDDDFDDDSDDERDSFDDSYRDDSYRERDAHDRHTYDAADDWTESHTVSASAEHRSVEHRSTEHRSAEHRSTEPRRTSRSADRPEVSPAHRPGRGGFDPEHDAATAAFRYRRRRFVTLLLVLLTGGLTAGAVLGISDKLWIGVGVTALVLVGYLAYLSRQVRIERAISARRRARMLRAKEIRPAAAREAEPVSPYRASRAETRRPIQPHRSRPAAPRTGPDERPAARSSHLPPMYRRVGTVVDLDDDDPAFDDLDHYEPVVYRRAAGQ